MGGGMVVGVGEDVLLFFFNDTATTEIYTLSLHDALPIWIDFDRVWISVFGGDPGLGLGEDEVAVAAWEAVGQPRDRIVGLPRDRKEHTSELQSRQYLVCRLLLEKKKTILSPPYHHLAASY